MLIVAFVYWLFGFFLRCRRQHGHRPRGRPFVPAACPALCTRKPEWVVDEVIRLKALMATSGCRKVADTFNRLHAARHAMTVSKSYVAATVRGHRLEIEHLRSEWKRRIPPAMAANWVWGMDLTGKVDVSGIQHPILGVVDHGSRFAVVLAALRDKSTIAILRAFLDAIERHGRPRAIRTDNEAVFTSRLFRFVLAVLGIRHQRSEPHCPWQNVFVERLWRSVKYERVYLKAYDGVSAARGDIAEYLEWYNAHRSH